jgi:hypothetical protein
MLRLLRCRAMGARAWLDDPEKIEQLAYAGLGAASAPEARARFAGPFPNLQDGQYNSILWEMPRIGRHYPIYVCENSFLQQGIPWPATFGIAVST